ncbi:MAG: hypothetical protein KJZ73_03490 [Pseudorhodoplanes sp.]|nr:hypothetical protein [Pseudorhodoplanes sp.]MBW7950142.1 hypothetical protein [Pseudorhodoplanes sp.]MCL4710286.1 hypothetical protein [Pseudorhodoplanes sp.]GIK79392.1 MAG: hypothetical protein BroJett024_04970 [Alphaproteobacteria bacterium]
MSYVKAAAGALAIMVASGMIADFELLQGDDTILVRVWSADDQPDAHLRRQVAAHLPRHVDEARVIVVR